MKDRETDKMVLAGYYARYDKEREIPPQASMQRELKAGDMEGLLSVLQQVENDWARMVRKVCWMSGLKVCRAGDLLRCSRTLMVRFMYGKTDRIPLPVFAAIAELTGRSVEQVCYKREQNPLVLPRMHMAWIRRIKSLSEEDRAIAGTLLSQKLRPGAEPVSAMEYAGIVARRMSEYTDDAGLRTEDLGREKGLVFPLGRRVTLRNTDASQIFLARNPVLMLIGLIAGCALDYFLCWDYSGYPGMFADKEGHEVILDQTEREILSLLLRCDDPAKVNETIGWLCAVSENKKSCITAPCDAG